MNTITRTALGAIPDGEPLAEIRRLKQAQRELSRAEAEQVRRARTQGYSWLAIAAALDVSKQAAHRKFGKQ